MMVLSKMVKAESFIFFICSSCLNHTLLIFTISSFLYNLRASRPPQGSTKNIWINCCWDEWKIKMFVQGLLLIFPSHPLYRKCELLANGKIIIFNWNETWARIQHTSCLSNVVKLKIIFLQTEIRKLIRLYHRIQWLDIISIPKLLVEEERKKQSEIFLYLQKLVQSIFISNSLNLDT